MRILFAILAGLAAHLIVSICLSFFVWPSTFELTDDSATAESAHIHEQNEGIAPLFLWAIALAVAVLPAFTGGAIAGRIARSKWLIASTAIGLWSAMLVLVALNSVGEEPQYLLGAVGVLAAIASALAAGSRSGVQSRAAAS